MNIEACGGGLSDLRSPARFFQELLVSNGKQECVGEFAGTAVMGKEGVDIKLQRSRKCREFRASRETSQGHVNEEVLSAVGSYLFPLLGIGYTLDDQESSPNAPKLRGNF